MIDAVMGIGPRTGTSFVMRKLHEAGLPVYWTRGLDLPPEGNPLGYYETEQEELRGLDNVIVKVWPRFALHTHISSALVLRRERESQLASIRKQIVREGYSRVTPEQQIDFQELAMDRLTMPRLAVRTEDLDERIDEIIGWFHVKHRRAA